MAKHKYIESPEFMWKLFESYKKATKSNPFLQHDFVGKDGDSVHREKERALTIEGFECYVLDFTELTYPDLTNYFEGKGSYDKYLPICSRIKKEIRRDQIEGGLSNVYNPSITQRLNNLKETTESIVKEQPLFPDSSKETGEEIG